MKAKRIFYSWALIAVAMMLFTLTACSSDDNLTENKIETPAVAKDYTIPVTVKVSRQGENAATRASYDESTKILSFSTGDQLFIQGTESTAGNFAGTLIYTSTTDDASTFTGDIYTTHSYSGTADDLLTAASSSGSVSATLLPNGYGSYFNITGSGSGATLNTVAASSFVAGDKAAGVAQLSYEKATSYISNTGFALTPQNAILNCTISGLAANTSYTMAISDASSSPSGSVTTNDFGVANFCVGFSPDGNSKTYTVTISGSTYSNIDLSSKTLNAGKIYNVNKVAIEQDAIDLRGVAASTTYRDGTILTGTLGANVKISIADGATVTLKDVTINGTKNESYTWAGITCEGSATINLEGTNTVKGFERHYPGLYVPSGSTLTIQSPSGIGKLTASSNGYGSGIGGGFNISCGNIVIKSGIITATGGSNCTGIGNGYAADGTSECGYITINGGDVTANGGDNGAGIGCGRAVGTNIDTSSKCGTITINGGTVTATGGQYGAGIGCGQAEGYSANATTTCGNIAISGGNVNATGGQFGAGIGCGRAWGSNSNTTYIASCGAIEISGGTVEATGGHNAAGIGCGVAAVNFPDNNNIAKSICTSITIYCGTGQTQVKATKGEIYSSASNYESIGKGSTSALSGTLVSEVTGIIKIGDNTYWTGSGYENEGASYLGRSPLTYPSSSN